MVQNVEHFEPAVDASQGVPWRVKPLVELLFLLTTLTRHGVDNASTRTLQAFAKDAVHRFDWREIAAYDASAAVVLALVNDFCRTTGLRIPWDSSYFAGLLNAGYFEGTDRLPYREMDLAYCLDRVGLGDAREALAFWLRSTAFGMCQPSILYALDDIYSLTHAVFYVTDVGKRALEDVIARTEAARMREALVLLTGMLLRADDADLLGELILCWRFADVANTKTNAIIASAALSRLLAVQLPDGAMPCPQFNAAAVRSPLEYFQFNYHPTLVAALTFSAWKSAL